jgi:HlyD family secretion protein
MKINWKKAIIVSLVVIAIVAGFMLATQHKYKPPNWKAQRIDRGDITLVVTATGTVFADTVVVGAQVSGRIEALMVDFDSTVKKGQVIAVLDTTLLAASAQQARASVQKAAVQVILQKRAFNRIDTLFHQKVADLNDYDQAYTAYRAAEADLANTEAAYKHERTTLRYATIKAPINGTVLSRNANIGQTVISSFNAPSLFVIAKDLKKMQVYANVDEADIGQVKVKQLAQFNVDAYPYDTFRGEIGQVRLQPISVQNVTNYIVVISAPNPDLKLRPGLTANITIKVQEHNNVLRAPGNAIRFVPPADYLKYIGLSDSAIRKVENERAAANEVPRPGSYANIWIRNGKELEQRRVQVGLFDGVYVEVTGNIAPGDEVVVGTGNTKTAAAGSEATKNPFMPQMPTRRATGR